MPQALSQPRPSDRWFPWYFVAFFVVLISVLVPMAIIAVRTNTGLVTENAYNKGLAYNTIIHAGDQQKSLGWHSDLSFTSAGNKIGVDFFLTDHNNMALDKADVKLWLVRPTQAGMDQSLVMKSQTSGHYSVESVLPISGVWEARVSATINGQNYQTVKRVIVP